MYIHTARNSRSNEQRAARLRGEVAPKRQAVKKTMIDRDALMAAKRAELMEQFK